MSDWSGDAWHKDLSDLEIILDSTNLLKELNFPNCCGLNKVDLGEEHLKYSNFCFLRQPSKRICCIKLHDMKIFMHTSLKILLYFPKCLVISLCCQFCPSWYHGMLLLSWELEENYFSFLVVDHYHVYSSDLSILNISH